MGISLLKDELIAAAREYYAATEAMIECNGDNDDSETVAARASAAQINMESAMHELDTAIANQTP